jgi:uncharacterized protein YxjI
VLIGPSSGPAPEAYTGLDQSLIGDPTMSFAPSTFVLNQQLFSLGGDLWIEDAAGNHVYGVRGKVLSLRRHHTLVDPAGNALYEIGQSLAHVRRTFEVKRGDEVVATIQEALVRVMGDHFSITLAGGDELKVTGDFINREFHVVRGGADVILVSRRLLSIRDSYGVQVAEGFEVPLALAIVVCLEQMELEERKD